MLIFTRRTNDEIVIQGNIRVRVIAVGRDRARIGVIAPDSVTVDREEVFERRRQARPSPEDAEAPTRPTTPKDYELGRRIENFLARLQRAVFRGLKVEVQGGRVIIRGRVHTYHQKQLATHCCQRVAGVRRVVNEIQVGGSPRGHELPEQFMPDD